MMSLNFGRRFARNVKKYSKVFYSIGGGGEVSFPKLQFDKSILTDSGELPQGEVPDALRYSRNYQHKRLSNNVTVVSEQSQGNLGCLTVTVRTGTRYETLENSGVSQFLQVLNFRGTSRRTREQIQNDLAILGNNISVQTGRELTTYQLVFPRGSVEAAVDLLSDCLLNSTYAEQQVVAERQGIAALSDNNTVDQYQFTVEQAHYTSFRDHYISQPLLGTRENVENISSNVCREFHANNYVGENIIVSGTGNINSDQLFNLVEKHFGKAPAAGNSARPNTEQPYFTPSIISSRDDEMVNLNYGVYMLAPSASSPDYFTNVTIDMINLPESIQIMQTDNTTDYILSLEQLQTLHYKSVITSLIQIVVYQEVIFTVIQFISFKCL